MAVGSFAVLSGGYGWFKEIRGGNIDLAPSSGGKQPFGVLVGNETVAAIAIFWIGPLIDPTRRAARQASNRTHAPTLLDDVGRDIGNSLFLHKNETSMMEV